MILQGVPSNLDFTGIPVDLVTDPDNMDLKQMFYECTLLYYVWSLVYSELLETSQVDLPDGLIQRTLYLHNAMSLITYRLSSIYLALSCRLGDDPSIKVSINNEHECVYIELPIQESPHPKMHFIKCFAYLPTCYLPSYTDASGKLWINLGGLPSGTRVLVGQTWLTVQ